MTNQADSQTETCRFCADSATVTCSWPEAREIKEKTCDVNVGDRVPALHGDRKCHIVRYVQRTIGGHVLFYLVEGSDVPYTAEQSVVVKRVMLECGAPCCEDCAQDRGGPRICPDHWMACVVAA